VLYSERESKYKAERVGSERAVNFGFEIGKGLIARDLSVAKWFHKARPRRLGYTKLRSWALICVKFNSFCNYSENLPTTLKRSTHASRLLNYLNYLSCGCYLIPATTRLGISMLRSGLGTGIAYVGGLGLTVLKTFEAAPFALSFLVPFLPSTYIFPCDFYDKLRRVKV
jgi:hypothetical protein